MKNIKIKSIYNPRNYSPNVIFNMHNNNYEKIRKKELLCALGALIFSVTILIIMFLIITS